MTDVTLVFKYLYPSEYGGTAEWQESFVHPVTYQKSEFEIDIIAKQFAVFMTNYNYPDLIAIGASLWNSKGRLVTVSKRFLPDLEALARKFYANEPWKLQIMLKILSSGEPVNEEATI